jgi:hypothetical protein
MIPARQIRTATVVIAIAVLSADDSHGGDTVPDTIPKVVCKYICPPLDDGFKMIDSFVRLKWAQWKGRTRSMAPSPLPGRGAECGRLPDAEGQQFCCVNRGERITIEYVGENPYLYPETTWRAVCKTD